MRAVIELVSYTVESMAPFFAQGEITIAEEDEDDVVQLLQTCVASAAAYVGDGSSFHGR